MPTTLKKIAQSLFEVRREDWGKTLWMFSYIFLLIAAYVMLKSVRDSLFLYELGPEKLPYVYILIALMAGSIATVFSRLLATAKIHRLIFGTSLFLISNLFVFWWLLRFEGAWLFYSLYVWVSIFGIITTSQFWLLANHLFNPREAKRTFGIIGTGATLGGIVGGFLTKTFVEIAGTTNLLLIGVGLFAATLGLLLPIWRLAAKDSTQATPRSVERDHQGTPGLISSIVQSKYLILIVALVGLTAFISNLIDFEFKSVVSNSLKSKDQITAFFGVFFGWLGIASVIVQFFFTGKILKILGTTSAILFLPLALFFGSFLLALFPLIWAASFLKGSDGSLRYSLHKSGTELLILPIPLALKKRTKIFVDMFVDRFADGLSGVLLLLLVSAFALTVQQISFILLPIIGIWICLSFIIRKQYVGTLREAIRKKQIDTKALHFKISDQAAIECILDTLNHPDESHVLYGLEFLESVQLSIVPLNLRKLLKHPSEEIRVHAMRLLIASKDQTLLPEIEGMLQDESSVVKTEALQGIHALKKEGAIDLMKSYLKDPDPKMKVAAIACIAQCGRESEKEIARNEWKQMVSNPEDHPARQEAAKVIGHITDCSFHKLLLDLFNETDKKVLLFAIDSAGRTGCKIFVKSLLPFLKVRPLRKQAQEALASCARTIPGTLHDAIQDQNLDREIRQRIPQILALNPSQWTIDLLLHSLSQKDRHLSFMILKALNRIRMSNLSFRFDPDKVKSRICQETHHYFALLNTKRSLLSSPTALDKADPLIQALNDHTVWSVERIFRLLRLIYPDEGIFHAYLQIVSNSAWNRATALEYLENILDKKIRTEILHVVDDIPENEKLQKAASIYRIEGKSFDDSVKELIFSEDSHLSALAIYGIGKTLPEGFLSEAENLVNSPDLLVRETAVHVTNRLRGS
ncbi:MAG: HEAT repeat domain-containing protein [Deltaproteobacteria bacterium]|nr:HEAT repeat domain-containing protein [Deltaproteobacteria bacterium]